MKTLLGVLATVGLALFGSSALGGPLVSTFFPLNDGDQTTFVYDNNQSLTWSVNDLGGGQFGITESSPDATATLTVQEDEDSCYVLSVREGWETVSMDPPIVLLNNDILQNGGTVTTTTTVSQTGISYPATFTVKVAKAGTVTVPADNYCDCRSITSSEKATIPGYGTVNESFLTVYLAADVGVIKTLVKPGVFAALVSGAVGGVDVTTIGCPDTVPPVLAISSPRSSQAVSNDLVTVTGTAKDNVAVAAVYYQLNGGSWTLAASSNSWATWTATVTPSPGASVIAAYAQDTSGNTSPTNTVAFKFVPSATLVMLPNGSGTVYWFRPAGKIPAVYQSGFTNMVPVFGSAYSPTTNPLLSLTSGQVTLDGGNLPYPITNQIILSPNNTITVSPPSTNQLALTINKTTGAISGSFANPANPKQTIKVAGVLLQNQTNAAGYFLGTNQSGAFLLEDK